MLFRSGSWAETDKGELNRGQLTFDKGKDRQGPVPVGVVATVEAKKEPEAVAEKGKEPTQTLTEKKKDDKEAEGRPPAGRLVVYGNSGFASNNFLNFSGNRDLFLNSISWLAEEEDQISIRPREAKNTPIFLTAMQGRLAFWLPVVIVPALLLVSGTSVVLRRRRSR